MHAGNWNILVPAGKENKQVIPLLAESEKGKGQAESPFEKKAEMWWDEWLSHWFKLYWNVRLQRVIVP